MSDLAPIPPMPEYPDSPAQPSEEGYETAEGQIFNKFEHLKNPMRGKVIVPVTQTPRTPPSVITDAWRFTNYRQLSKDSF